VVNRTTMLHLLYDGKITRSARRHPDGSWTVRTHGIGNNVLPGMATENQNQGPLIFDALDSQMRSYVARDRNRGN